MFNRIPPPGTTPGPGPKSLPRCALRQTNQEWNRLVYTINPDDVNIFDFKECITYTVLLSYRQIATMDGYYDFEYFDNGVFQAEIAKSKQIKLDENGKIAEIVRLIGGEVNSATAVAHANDLLQKANLFKK